MPGKSTAQNGPTSPRREFDPDDPDYIKDLQRPAVIKVGVQAGFSAIVCKTETILGRFKRNGTKETRKANYGI